MRRGFRVVAALCICATSCVNDNEHLRISTKSVADGFIAPKIVDNVSRNGHRLVFGAEFEGIHDTFYALASPRTKVLRELQETTSNCLRIWTPYARAAIDVRIASRAPLGCEKPSELLQTRVVFNALLDKADELSVTVHDVLGEEVARRLYRGHFHAKPAGGWWRRAVPRRGLPPHTRSPGSARGVGFGPSSWSITTKGQARFAAASVEQSGQVNVPLLGTLWPWELHLAPLHDLNAFLTTLRTWAERESQGSRVLSVHAWVTLPWASRVSAASEGLFHFLEYLQLYAAVDNIFAYATDRLLESLRHRVKPLSGGAERRTLALNRAYVRMVWNHFANDQLLVRVQTHLPTPKALHRVPFDHWALEWRTALERPTGWALIAHLARFASQDDVAIAGWAERHPSMVDYPDQHARVARPLATSLSANEVTRLAELRRVTELSPTDVCVQGDQCVVNGNAWLPFFAWHRLPGIDRQRWLKTARRYLSDLDLPTLTRKRAHRALETWARSLPIREVLAAVIGAPSRQTAQSAPPAF